MKLLSATTIILLASVTSVLSQPEDDTQTREPCDGEGYLSCKSVAPPCLQQCLRAYGACSACGSESSNIKTCINNVCGFEPLNQAAYAGIYLQSLCTSGGYLATNEDPFVNLTKSCDDTTYSTTDMGWSAGLHSQARIKSSSARFHRRRRPI